MFRRGLHELIASNTCVRQFSGFELGAGRPVHGVDWPIVGLFDQGQGQQCVVYTDADVLMSTFGSNAYTRLGAMLESPGSFEPLRAAVQSEALAPTGRAARSAKRSSKTSTNR